MTKKRLFSALLLGAISLGASMMANANERQYYETRICEGCDYNYALATATEIKPAINCSGENDPFNSGTAQTQQCFATPIKILVVDANTRNIWHFENTYANQGQPLYSLTNEVNYHSQTPAEAIELVNQLLDIYKIMDELAVEYTNRWNAGEFDHITNTTNLVKSTKTSTDPCENYEYSDALNAAFDVELRDLIQLGMQQGVFSRASFIDRLLESKVINGSFNIGTPYASIGGTWKQRADPKFTTFVYGSDALTKRTQVTFTSSMTNDGLELTLNEIQTYFNGITLKNLKTQVTSSAKINQCLGNALDAAYPKVVAGSGNTVPSKNNIALFGSGHGLPSGTGSSGGTTTCKHTYYINGIEMMSFEGSCP